MIQATTLKQKIFLILSSIVLTVVIVELFLRLAGFLFLFSRDIRNRISLKNKNFYRVMCVGESTTFLGGEDSYPSQLEKILNNSGLAKQFKVINKGMPAKDSKYIVENIDSWIKECNPDLVLVMMGINDHGELSSNYDDFIKSKLQLFLKHLQIYKLYKHIKLNLLGSSREIVQSRQKQKYQAATANQEKKEELMLKALTDATISFVKKDYKNAEKKFSILAKSDFKEDYIYRANRELLKVRKAMGKKKELIDVIKFFLEKNPYDYEATLTIQSLCRQKDTAGRMIDALLEAKKISPDHPHICALLGYCYAKNDNMSTAQKYNNKARELRVQKYNPNLKKHYNEIVKRIKENKMLGIYVQYPLREVDSLKNMLKDSENFQKLVFVDNQDVFEKAVNAGKYEDYFSDRFAGNFGHCTKEGNYILAENIASAIISEFFN